MINLESILKSRGITLTTKVHLIKAMVFPVVMYGCESWTVKKAERWWIDVFELWCWRRLLSVPWTAWRSNRSILKEICPYCSLGGLMLKLRVQYFGHLMRKADSFEKTLMLGKFEEEKGITEDEMVGWHHRLNGHESVLLNCGIGEDSWESWSPGVDSWSWLWTERSGVLQAMGSQRVRHNWATELCWSCHGQ